MPDMPPPIAVLVPPAPPPVPTQSVTPWYEDKALYVMALGVVLPFLSGLLGLQLDPVKVASILVPVVTYIIAHKAKSGAVLVAEIKARATAAPAPTTPQGAADALTGLLAPQ